MKKTEFSLDISRFKWDIVMTGRECAGLTNFRNSPNIILNYLNQFAAVLGRALPGAPSERPMAGGVESRRAGESHRSSILAETQNNLA